MRAIVAKGLALLALGAPALTSADAFKPSKSEQVKLGKRVSAAVRKQEKVLPATDRRVRFLRDLASRLLATIPEDAGQPWEYSFDVIDSKQVNAFALPGGPIYFYTGLLDKLTTEDQVAGVIAHEITHIRKEHWARAYADQQKRELGLTILLIITRANSTIANAASIANDVVLTLPYGRKQETEADDLGFEMMAKAGYNPQGIVEVFETLRKASKGGKPPEFLSTHPDDKNRIKRIEDRIARSSTPFRPQRPLPFETAAMKSGG